jgi:hypothetical protein
MLLLGQAAGPLNFSAEKRWYRALFDATVTGALYMSLVLAWGETILPCYGWNFIVG